METNCKVYTLLTATLLLKKNKAFGKVRVDLQTGQTCKVYSNLVFSLELNLQEMII